MLQHKQPLPRQLVVIVLVETPKWWIRSPVDTMQPQQHFWDTSDSKEGLKVMSGRACPCLVMWHARFLEIHPTSPCSSHPMLQSWIAADSGQLVQSVLVLYKSSLHHQQLHSSFASRPLRRVQSVPASSRRERPKHRGGRWPFSRASEITTMLQRR